ncbi:hypothetical protein [Nocardioides sp. SLBN-35]|uniref:hypothetical protein n=1 Tax=Nocardioides sp. SLBN-35 TaxID=2768445 RepID=UPI00114DD7CA|nr:hypothetical protein [Nocardioides sp. SLBN-35]TQK69731.1 hypothetical protein FBY23_1497 [Nocardioides sp. SLBN-35]
MSLVTTARRALAGTAVAGVLAGLASIVPLPEASAVSAPGAIVYIKDHNVWLADGAGGQARQVTTGGTPGDPWQSPTQSDAGVVVAHHSGLIYRMNQRGEVFNVIDPPDLVDVENNVLQGRDLTETAISPDGTKIAYTYAKVWYGIKHWATGYTAAGYASDPAYWGVSFQDKPSWVTNNRVILSVWNRLDNHLYDLGQRDIRWFDERVYRADAKELSDFEVSRNGAWTVATRGDVGDESIVVLRNHGDVLTSPDPANPTLVCEPVGDGALHEPTIAPDSASVAWAEPDGIWRMSIQDCVDDNPVFDLIIPGGSDPTWSAATVGVTPDVPQGGQNGAFTATTAPKVKGQAKVGKVLKAKAGAWSPAPTAVSYQWLRNGKPIKKAKKASYRVTRKDRGKRISVRLTISRPGLASTTWTSAPKKVKR